jgi:micrococcal nuclease
VKGRVVGVVDGDTIHVRVGRRLEKVRYIGFNAPEVPHPEARGWREGGPRALEINRRLVAGQDVRLELDLVHRDNWGLLAYAWVKRGRKRVMANAEMVRRGYAQVMTIPPNVKYQERFLKLQREAREARRGLWGEG